jgi:hypothetical protein
VAHDPRSAPAIEGWLKRHGHRLVDLEKTSTCPAGSTTSPNLEDLVGQVERGELGGLVVAKVDRFSRDLAYGAMVARVIERAGGTFVAADDGVVLSPKGRDFGGNDAAHFLFAQLLNDVRLLRPPRHARLARTIDRHVYERGRHWGSPCPSATARVRTGGSRSTSAGRRRRRGFERRIERRRLQHDRALARRSRCARPRATASPLTAG